MAIGEALPADLSGVRVREQLRANPDVSVVQFVWSTR